MAGSSSTIAMRRLMARASPGLAPDYSARPVSRRALRPPALLLPEFLAGSPRFAPCSFAFARCNAAIGGKDMTTRADVLEHTRRPVPITWRAVAAELGRLLGLAFALALALGLLLTAAT